MTGSGTSDTTQLALQCPVGEVAWGAPVTCTLPTSNLPENTVTNIEWSVEDGSNSQSGGESWGGHALETLTVVVSFSLLGQLQTMKAKITVASEREWNWQDDYSVTDIGAFGSPCVDWKSARDVWGQLTPQSCDITFFNYNGYEIDDAGGPWAGQSIVTTKDVAVTLLKALRPGLYQTAPKHPRPAAGNTFAGAGGASWATALINGCDNAFSADTTTLTVWQVNRKCGVSTGYDDVVTKVGAHEDQHASDILGEVGSHNITSHWDMLIGTTSEVDRKVNEVLGPAIAAVEIAADKADAAEGGDIGWIWRWSETNDGWLWYLVSRIH